jgi:hypothetical protein
MANIFSRRSSLPTVSKAALKSKPITATTFALAETQAAWALARAVVHDLPFRKPCCDVVRMLFAFMKAGSGWRSLPTAAFAISQRTAGELFDSDSLARFDISLSRLTRAVTLFLTALYLKPRLRESFLAISAKVSGQRYRGSVPSLTVILYMGAARSMPWTMPLLTNVRTMSGSLIWYTSAQSQDSSAQRRAGGSSCLKFLRSMVLVEGVTLLTDTDVSRGKWSVVVSESTLTVATRSLVTQMWSRTNSCSLASPSSLTCWPWDLYVIPVSKYLMLESATALL